MAFNASAEVLSARGQTYLHRQWTTLEQSRHYGWHVYMSENISSRVCHEAVPMRCKDISADNVLPTPFLSLIRSLFLSLGSNSFSSFGTARITGLSRLKLTNSSLES